TEKSRLDRGMIHRYLSEESYWARKIPRDLVERSIENSLCFGAFDGSRQAGFARVITDSATFVYLGDVFVLPSHRGGEGPVWITPRTHCERGGSSSTGSTPRRAGSTARP